MKARYFVPFLGWFLLGRDGFFRHELIDFLENLVLYFFLGIAYGFMLDALLGFTVLVNLWIFITLFEYVLIKKWGHKFPKILDWDVRGNKEFTLKMFYLLTLHSLYAALIGMGAVYLWRTV